MLGDDWIKWIKTCYNKGCNKSVTMQVMLDRGHDQTVVEQSFDAHWNPEEYISPYDISHHYLDLGTTDPRVEILNRQPVVVLIHDVLSREQCEAIRELGKDLHRANVVHGEGRAVSESRTSDLMYLRYGQTPEIKHLENEIARVSGIPVNQGEALQMLRYQVGQYYRPHNDFFHNDTPVTRLKKQGQRIATAVTYLNDVEEGGETFFPNLNIRVQPKMGSTVYFEYTDADGKTTDRCLHSSEPVTQGEKWVVTKWLRQKVVMPQSVTDSWEQPDPVQEEQQHLEDTDQTPGE